jgi:quercetin dioxygenase-like cupin family protein
LGYATPSHSHEAEEVAIVLEGTGRIEVGDDSFEVAPGSVVLAPPDVPHRTIADKALTILWVYVPAGSEQRWIPSKTESKVE